MRASNLLLLLGSFLFAGAALPQHEVRIPWGSESLAMEARAGAPGGRIVLDGLRLGEETPELALDLERIEAFAHGARVVVHGEHGVLELAPPDDVRFKGRVIGEPDSAAVLSVLEDGTIRGVVSREDGYWILGGEGPIESGRVPRKGATTGPFAEGFRCESSGREPPGASPVRERRSSGGKATSKHTAVIAIETDFELYQHFGSAEALSSYVGDLVAFSSGIYDDELDTNLLVGDLFVWSTAKDPWLETDASCGLLEFGKFWHESRSLVDRTLAHFLSGKSGGSGIAWIGVLCGDDFSVTQDRSGFDCPRLPASGIMGGAYGFTKGISGSFDPAAGNVVWDILAFTHEVGHNFDSPHTHCYEGLGGMSGAVDECYVQSGSTCYGGETTSLPAGCPGPGAHCGTIMSYCHLRTGGMSNIALSLGRGFSYGLLPDRVPDRMRSHVEENAACMPRIDPESIFADGFEDGSTAHWSTP